MELDLEFLSLKGCCKDSSESTLVKMPHCWKTHVTAQIILLIHLFQICFILSSMLVLITPTFVQGCIEPQDLEGILLNKLQELYSDSANFMTTPMQPPLEDTATWGITHSFSITLRTLTRSCSETLKLDSVSGDDLQLNQASTCPWRNILRVDPERIPSAIMEAECICNGTCVQYDNKCSKERGSPCYQYTGRCEQVFSQRVAFRRECSPTSSVYEYTAGLLPVAVGCTCVRNAYVEGDRETVK